jgi:hypothetical protein
MVRQIRFMNTASHPTEILPDDQICNLPMRHFYEWTKRFNPELEYAAAYPLAILKNDPPTHLVPLKGRRPYVGVLAW